MLFILLCFTAKVLKVCRTPGPIYSLLKDVTINAFEKLEKEEIPMIRP